MMKFIGYPWNKIIRRDFLAQNDIRFPLLRSGEDHIFTFKALCLAKNILKIPTPYYVWRQNQKSFTHDNLPAEKMIHRWTDSLFRGVKLLEDFMNKFEVLKNHSDYKYLVLNTIIEYHTNHILPIYAQIPAFQLDSLIRHELENIDDKTALTAFLFNRMNLINVTCQSIIRQQQLQIQKLQVQLQQAQNSFQFSNESIFKI